MTNKIIILLFCTLTLVSCKEKTKEKRNKDMNNLQQAPYNIDDIGDGNKFNYDTLSIDYIKEKKKILLTQDFKFPDNDLFNKRVLEVFKINLPKYSNDIVRLRNSMFPEIAIRTDRCIIFDDPDNNTQSQELFHYNSFVFYDNKESLAWLKVNGKQLLEDLVVAYGYTGNDELNSTIFKNYNYLNSVSFEVLIFDRGEKLKIRENVLDQIIKYSYGGPTTELSYAKEGDGFIESYTIIENIDKNKNDYDNPDKIKAILFEKQLQVGITGFLDNYLEDNPDYKDKLKKENFYNFERLQEYIMIIYQNKDDQNDVTTYFIKDSDGYTNLRKEKTTSSTIIEKVKSGETVELIERSGDWYFVRTKAGNKGYVFKTKIVSK